jgi:hypothetical protein
MDHQKVATFQLNRSNLERHALLVWTKEDHQIRLHSPIVRRIERAGAAVDDVAYPLDADAMLRC